MKSKLSLLCALSLMSFSTTFVHAGDAKQFPGAMCQKELGSVSYAAGTIRNNSNTGSATMTCPVVRDVISGSISSGHVRMYRATSSTTMCSLNASSSYGTTGYMQTKFKSGSPGYYTMNFSSMSDYNSAHYYYWCALSASNGSNKSKIISYRVSEN